MSTPKEKTKYIYDDGIGRVEYIDHMGNDKRIVAAARVSFGKDELTGKVDARDKKLIKYLTHNGHTSTLEHNILTMKFVVPLFVRSQHHRHRTWSYNEISRRYTSEGMEFYMPDKFRIQHKTNRQASIDGSERNPSLGDYSKRTASDLIASHVEMSLSLYNSLMEAGVCREQARMVLPQNLYTEYYGTANLNNLFKFLVLRLDPHAQWEIRQAAQAVLEFLREIYPIATKGFEDNVLNSKLGITS